jgi:DNA-directed RNA polymerase alpha subunit
MRNFSFSVLRISPHSTQTFSPYNLHHMADNDPVDLCEACQRGYYTHAANVAIANRSSEVQPRQKSTAEKKKHIDQIDIQVILMNCKRNNSVRGTPLH